MCFVLINVSLASVEEVGSNALSEPLTKIGQQPMKNETTPPVRQRRKMKRKAAAIVAGIMSVSGAAGATVLVQNFMSAEFAAGPPPCLIKTAGVDTTFDAFAFTLGTTTVDDVDLTEEKITISGLTGDRVSATEVYRIENNCAEDLEVTLVNGAQTLDWEQKHLEVWLGAVDTPAGYPEGVTGDWDDAPLVFGDLLKDPPATVNGTTGTVLVEAGQSVPVGMIVSTGAAAEDSGESTWTVQAERP